MRRRIVISLENLCGLLDRIPVYRRGSGWNASCWGCWPFRLAAAAVALDERWATGVWEPGLGDER